MRDQTRDLRNHCVIQTYHPMPQGLRLINKKVLKLWQNDRDEARFKNGEV